MKKETIKDYIKKWDIDQIVGYVYSEGMRFQATAGMTNADAKIIKNVVIKELINRIKTHKLCPKKNPNTSTSSVS